LPVATKAAGLHRARRSGRGPWRARLAACLGLAILFTADAGAMGLGAAVVQSGLGQPLRMSFPVAVQRDEEVGCVQVRAKNDELPGVLNTRTAVIRNGFQTRIEIRSILPVDEPAIGLVVSVGCASPISREYVIFLDPPVVAPTVEASADSAVALPPRAQRPAPPRRAPVTAAAAPRAAQPAARKPAAPSSPRAPGSRPPAATVTPSEAPQASSRPPVRTPAPSTAAPPIAKGDRLTIMPTEPPTSSAPAPAAGATSPAIAAPTVAPTTPGMAPSPGAAPVSPAPAPTPATGLPSTAPDAVEAAAREQAMRQQQGELQQQIKALSDQIAALKVQTTALASRNQELEQTGFSSTVVWLLVLLAVIAIVLAGWMAWRYTQLRRSVDGAAWWTGNTGLVPSDGSRSVSPETRSGLVALDAGTRLATRSEPEVAPVGSSRTSASNVERPRPAAPRSQRYPAPIETDFTVSDIEAAMATVRTVSPPRAAPRPAPIDDGDLAPLGGQTLPSPFTDPPPPAMPPPSLQSSASRRAGPIAGDDAADFVDIDIPPLPTPRASPATKSASTPPFTPLGGSTGRPGTTDVTGRFADDETEPLDFKLDIPQTFDPLATDSMKTTIVDRMNPTSTMDYDLPSTPGALDFELPSATQIMSLTAGQPDPYAEPARHGATALDDLFAEKSEPGIDTILDLDDRDGSPLSTTEVDRLTTTAVEGPNGELVVPSSRALLARFADLMNQVDDVEASDPLKAIALLRQYVLRDEKIPTLLWLRLFQLYKTVDKKPVYEALAEHFSRRYQRPMVGWDQNLRDRVPQTPLSAMGEVDREIEALWGKEEGLERIRSLLCDRHLDDAIVFNAVLQRDLLDAAKVFPHGADSHIGGGGADA